MSIILVATSGLTGDRATYLKRMLASVAAASGTVDLSMYLLLQNTTPHIAAALLPAIPGFVTVSIIPEVVSVSAARNQLLKAVDSEKLNEASVVLFPDDDCWYPDGFLEAVHRRFQHDEELDLWFCTYDTKTMRMDRSSERPADAHRVIRHACSITMAIRGSVVKANGGFDEDIGVGARFKGGEDTMFALSALQKSRRAVYCEGALVGHKRDSERYLRVRAQYYSGTLLAMAPYTFQLPGMAYEVVRKVAIGGWFACLGEIGFGELFRVYMAALTRLWGQRRPKTL
jgi:hypothetical protein